MPILDRFSTADASRIVQELYGLATTAHALPGEYDANFRLYGSDGQTYLLKIARSEEPYELLTLQNAMLAQLAPLSDTFGVQRVYPTRSGALITQVQDNRGDAHFVRLLSFLPGRLLVNTRPHTPGLLRSLGHAIGAMDRALQGFDHPAAHRALKWDLANAEWIDDYLRYIPALDRRALVQRHLENYRQTVQPALAKVRWSVSHNDANDYNVLVEGTGYEAGVVGLIDFGDAVYTPTICNLAIALAYVMLDKPDPLAAAAQVVAGYHAAHSLYEDGLALLYPLALMRLAVSVANSAYRKIEDPSDPYIVVSEQPAWRALEQLEAVSPRLAHYIFRHACGLPPVPQTPALVQWLNANAPNFASVVGVDVRRAPVHVFDLSVGSLELGLPDELATTAAFTRQLFDQMAVAGAAVGIGRYDEARLIYTAEEFKTIGAEGPEYRTVHLGLDFFLPAGSPVYAPLDGVIHSFQDNTARLDYGPTIILEHKISPHPNPPPLRERTVRERAEVPLLSPAQGDELTFYTLYGHLSRESLAGLQVGMPVAKGAQIATIGDYPINGDWPPHLHFQIITDLLERQGEFPGVARPSDRAVWRALSPDPNLIAQIPAERFPPLPLRGPEILERRRRLIGYNLSISYKEPLTIVRGQGQYLFDDDGRRFLDGYNNVPHVGHNHPRVVRAAQQQLAVLNTNTRYLHENLVRYAERLTATLPEPLRVCFFVASGSEATELSIRLARAYTGQQDLIVSDGAYHGHTNTLIDISPYKAEGPGGRGLPEWVHKVSVPDLYRGRYRADDPAAGPKYAQEVASITQQIQAAGRGLAGFIIESIPSVGGQIVLPPGYLPEVYQLVRGAGGVCMADEVQTGFGRIGAHFWAFQLYGVTPDIVAMGKPIGNGFPMGAVVTTPEIAAAFNNGMEFFSTFGGNPVACAVGLAMLDVIETEKLQNHAQVVGDYFLQGLHSLMHKHSLIGDIRGLGLFLGLELVLDRQTRQPAPKQASYLANRMRDRGILIGTDGIYHNVLKVRGPLVFTKTDVDGFIATLDELLQEDAAQP